LTSDIERQFNAARPHLFQQRLAVKNAPRPSVPPASSVGDLRALRSTCVAPSTGLRACARSANHGEAARDATQS
jgi:hypothetical protein